MKKMISRVSKCLACLSLMILEVHAQERHKSLWVYFDLGDTVVSSKDMKKIKYIPGAKAYIARLHQQGFKVGMISNIPETWGMDYDEKLASLKKAILDGWVDTEAFDWQAFDEILLPLKNTEMKPAPHLFLKAIDVAQSCPSIYIGESQNEIKAAESHGMAAKLYDPTQSELYVPILELKNYILNNYKISYDEDCASE